MIGVPELHLSISLLVVTLSIIQGAPPGSIDVCPEEGEIRLQGSEEHVGLVEVCAGGEWKRLCDNGGGWTKSDAIVACRQLGYPTPERAANLESHTQSWDTPANATVPNCLGNEAKLSDCPTNPTPSNCATQATRVDCSRSIAIATWTINTSIPTALRKTHPPSTSTSTPYLVSSSLPSHTSTTITNTTREAPRISPTGLPPTTRVYATQPTQPDIYSLNIIVVIGSVVAALTVGLSTAMVSACMVRKRLFQAKRQQSQEPIQIELVDIGSLQYAEEVISREKQDVQGCQLGVEMVWLTDFVDRW